MKHALPLLAAVLAHAPLAAWQDTPAEAAFIDTARLSSAKYHDRSVAIADGYRQIGSDFPAMGEHWIRIGLLFDGIVDPAQPEVLTYVVVSGKPHLLGVAYILPLLPGESAPDSPVAKERWHDHFRTLEDETTMPRHHAGGHAVNVSRMAMLHAWVWLPNPNGIFAADNWGIPYFRLGIAPPQLAIETAAKALALASGGAEYFSAAINSAVPLTPPERRRVGAAFARSRDAVEALVGRGPVPALSSSELDTVWNVLWNRIDSSLGPKTRRSLQRAGIR